MEIEYSPKSKDNYAYSFSIQEKIDIVDGLKLILKKYDKKIEKLINHPNNEGQATFSCQIDDLKGHKINLECIINDFTSLK